MYTQNGKILCGLSQPGWRRRQKGDFIMTVTVAYKKGVKLSEEQIAEIEAAKTKPIVYDEDSPELTPAMEKAFLLAARNRNRYKKEIS